MILAIIVVVLVIGLPISYLVCCENESNKGNY